MSKPVKNLITQAYQQKFGGVTGAVLVEMRGMESNQANTLRNELAKKGMKVTIVKNSLARRAMQGTEMEKLGDLLVGPSALVYGGESVVNVARELMEAAKGNDKLQFKGALMDGQLFGPDEIEALSKYPTRDEAIANAVALFLSPGRNLVASVLGPGRKVAALVKAIEEKLEKGETIAKAG